MGCKLRRFALLQKQVEVENSRDAGEARNKSQNEGGHEGDHNTDNGIGHGVTAGFGTFRTSARSKEEKAANNEHDKGGETDERGCEIKDSQHEALYPSNGGNSVDNTAIFFPDLGLG